MSEASGGRCPQHPDRGVPCDLCGTPHELVQPRFLKQEGAIYIQEDTDSDVLFDSMWQAQLSPEEVLVGFESDGASFKSARVAKAGLIRFACEVLRELGSVCETHTGSESTTETITHRL